MNRPNSNDSNDQDSAVVYQETILGLQGTKVTGNRNRTPLKAFETFWTRVIALPPNPLHIALDAGVWVLGTNFVLLIAKCVPALTTVVMVPYLSFVLGLSISFVYVPSLRPLSAVRLVLLVLGIVLTF